ncbi:DUF1376 domain-containing protein [Acinetobacter colistiniresistens]|uniref:DUF1376 domain-containing protein n=1 Tax=Acinetobacter colistiniresistens TaxID=280145 RepID=UPI001D17E485|nr:DUF1376 domain-containing protein [Acinetobacter colistiniresistens]
MTLPKPPVQNNIDLRSFEFMPLDVVRFRDSDFTALVEAEAFRSGFLLMCASWHQVPAGSLPNDDRILSNLAGFGRVVKEWEKFKDEALRGWVLCDDNRYYHPVVCEKALESWNSKQEYNYKKFFDRLRKSNSKLDEWNQVEIPSFDIWVDAGMPDSWSNNSNVKKMDNNHNNKESIDHGSDESTNVPQESQKHSEGIPLENALKGTEPNITEHNVQGEVRDKDNSHTQNAGEKTWSPKPEILLNVIRQSMGVQAEQVIAMPDFQFHLGNFNAHWEDKIDLTENQKTRKFAQWLIQEFKKPKRTTSLLNKQPNLNVNAAHGQVKQYATCTDDVDTGDSL